MSQAHTGEPVPLTAIGVGALRLERYLDNTDVAWIIADIMGVADLMR